MCCIRLLSCLIIHLIYFGHSKQKAKQYTESLTTNLQNSIQNSTFFSVHVRVLLVVFNPY